MTAPRLVICRDGLAAEALNANQLAGVANAMRHYDHADLIPRLLATIYAVTDVEGDA